MADLQTTGYVDPYAPTRPGLESFYPAIYNLWAGGAPSPLTPQQQVAPLTPLQQQGIGQLASYGTTGPGGDILNFTAGQLGQGLNLNEVAGYADNPYMDSMITAALRDPSRALLENTLPGMELGQAFSGNLGSTRGDLAEAVAIRGFEDRAADIAAGMRGGAYQTGLGAALATRGQDAQMAQLANAIGLGNIDALMYGGGMQQDYQQALRNAAMGNWGYNVNAPWQFASNYASLATPGARSFGTVYGEDVTMDLNDRLWEAITQGGLSALGL